MNKQKIDYVLFHLNLLINIDDLKNNFKFISQTEINTSDFRGKIIFLISDKDFNSRNTIYINNIPVLFPLEKEEQFYKVDHKNNLIFTQDLITSSFYLLSGLQEYKSTIKDDFGRFPFEISIQKKLGIIKKPIVNYYFEIIITAIKEWGILNNVKISTKKLFENFGIFLTHDVDRIDTFNYYEVGYRLKVLLGFSPSEESIGKKIRSFLFYFFNWVNFFKKNNPHWDFKELRRLEKKYNYNSVFFFLPKDQLHIDSYYSYHEKRIQNLINDLDKDNCEIGLHGTVRSTSSSNAMEQILADLTSVSPKQVIGIRQHRLVYQNPSTALIQEKARLRYDSTLGFAEYEGFRNSFCLPFRVFDHEHNRMSNIWEFPLIAMDTTLFKYRKLSVVDALTNLNEIIVEIKKFNGLFTFLWHNGFQAENHYLKNIESFYDHLLNSLKINKGEGILGRELLKKLQEEDNA